MNGAPPNAQVGLPKGVLVYKSFQNKPKLGDFRLCYKFDIYSVEPLERKNVYVDAQSGDIVFKEDKICYTDYTGTAYTKYSGTKSIKTTVVSSNYVFKENDRGGGINTYNMQRGTSYYLAVNFTDNDNVWNNVNSFQDEVATDAHYGAEVTYVYYYSKFGRNSYDNAGAPINSYVHYGNNYNNAFWDGFIMTYGDGDGSYFTPLVCVDVCAHEITHAVTSNSAKLVYSNESGALNESFSDIFGKAVAKYANPSTTSWLIGDEITPNGNGIRSMDNPNMHGDPDTYGGLYYYTGSGDNGGVHINSGVQNHWFYLLCEGGSGTNDLGNAYTVSPIGINKAAAVAYRCLTTYLTSNSDYDDARYYSIKSAQDLYGTCSNEAYATAAAWYAVGVGLVPSLQVKALFTVDNTYACTTSQVFTFTNNSQNISTYTWYFGDGTSSTATNPTKTYNSPGTYQVSLVAYGSSECSSGQDTYVYPTQLVVENSATPVDAFCDEPRTIGTSSQAGIRKVVLNGVQNTSLSSTEGYKDFTCSFKTSLRRRVKYTLELSLDNAQDQNIWAAIDYNSNGIFESGEVIAQSVSKGMVSVPFIVPGHATIGTPLRMRIGANLSYYTPPNGCSDVSYG